MGNKVNIVFCLLLIAVINQSEAAPANRLVLENFISNDTDNTSVNWLHAGYKHFFKNKQYIGALFGTGKYHGEDVIDQDKNFTETKLTGFSHLADKTSLKWFLSSISGEDWIPTSYNFTLAHEENTALRIEASINKGIVETASAIEKHLTIRSADVSMDIYFTPQHTLVVGLLSQSVSDGNNRRGQILQYIYQPKSLENLYIKFRIKNRNADFNPAEYFFPASHKQYQILAGYSFILDKKETFVLKIEAGPGEQYIDNQRESAHQYKINLRGWINQSTSVNIKYECSSDGGTQSYKYCATRALFQYYW